MAGSLLYAVGYRGYGKIKPKSGAETVMLCTGGDLKLTQEPIESSAVWGAWWKNAAKLSYAFNYLRLEGSMNIELCNVDHYNETLQQVFFTDRGDTHKFYLYPDGVNGYEGDGWCTGLSFDASEGSVLTSSLNFIGDPGASGNPVTAGTEIVKNSPPLNNTDSPSDFKGDVLIPYWATYLSMKEGNDESETPKSDIVSWNVGPTADITPLKLCTGDNMTADINGNFAPLGPDYFVLGEMSATGSFTVMKISSDFLPDNYHVVRSMTAHIKNPKDAVKWMDLSMGNILVSDGSISLKTGSDYITTEFSFTAYGTGARNESLVNCTIE